MKFKNFLIESEQPPPLPGQAETVDSIANLLKKDCNKWLTEFKGNVMYRGLKKPVQQAYTIITPRTDRIPTDTPPALSEVLDEWFLSKFNWMPRKTGVFVTPQKATAEYYGYTHMFFPIGDYKYIWSPECHDLYSKLSDAEAIFKQEYFDSHKAQIEHGNKLSELKDLRSVDIDTIELAELLDAQRYTNRGAMQNGFNEMMVSCKSYILMPDSLGYKVLERLGIK